MATKAELEAELADLKQQMAEREKADRVTPEEPSEPEAPASDAVTAETQSWEALFEELTTELENLPQKKPLLLALGAFGLGYMLGRSTR